MPFLKDAREAKIYELAADLAEAFDDKLHISSHSFAVGVIMVYRELQHQLDEHQMQKLEDQDATD